VPRLIWSPESVRDVQRLDRFLAPKSPDAARRAVKAIRLGVKVLTQQAGLGRHVEHMSDEVRDWIIDFGGTGCVARYRIDREAVTIVAVWHQKETGG
jgi:plasmid stabilization system protein ParE